MTNQVFAFYVFVASRPEFSKVVNHRTSGKAKSEFLSDLTECWPNYKFTDLRAQKIGRPQTSEQFRRNAEYRGLPSVTCGDRVCVGAGRGVIVGHNSSANFDVLFDDDSPKYAGLTLNVHPASVELETQSCQV